MDAELIEFVDGDQNITSDISVRLTAGHTRGHQSVMLGGADNQAIYMGDICPTVAHLPTFWTLAYDQFLLDVRRIKPLILGEAADNRWLVLFNHDPNTRAAYLKRSDRGPVVIQESVTF